MWHLKVQTVNLLKGQINPERNACDFLIALMSVETERRVKLHRKLVLPCIADLKHNIFQHLVHLRWKVSFFGNVWLLLKIKELKSTEGTTKRAKKFHVQAIFFLPNYTRQTYHSGCSLVECVEVCVYPKMTGFWQDDRMWTLMASPSAELQCPSLDW